VELRIGRKLKAYLFLICSSGKLLLKVKAVSFPIIFYERRRML